MKRPRLMYTPPIQPDQLVQLVLSAYYLTVRHNTPSRDDPEPELWSSPNDFGSMLEDQVRMRLGNHLWGPSEPAFPGMRLRVPEPVEAAGDEEAPGARTAGGEHASGATHAAQGKAGVA